MPSKLPRPPERDYSATPLARKLGLLTPSEDRREIGLVAAPEGFRESLLDPPPHIHFRDGLSPKTTLALCFVRTLPELHAVLEMLSAKLPRGASAWIIRPKSHLKPGFNEHDVRGAALAIGLVDYKICSVSDEWSGIKFAWRKEP